MNFFIFLLLKVKRKILTTECIIADKEGITVKTGFDKVEHAYSPYFDS